MLNRKKANFAHNLKYSKIPGQSIVQKSIVYLQMNDPFKRIDLAEKNLRLSPVIPPKRSVRYQIQSFSKQVTPLNGGIHLKPLVVQKPDLPKFPSLSVLDQRKFSQGDCISGSSFSHKNIGEFYRNGLLQVPSVGKRIPTPSFRVKEEKKLFIDVAEEISFGDLKKSSFTDEV